jgi:hypothetical protein
MNQKYCRQCCELLVRRPLEHGNAKLIISHNHNDAPLVNKGEFLLFEELDYSITVPLTHFVDMDSMNLIDHKDETRLNGCCGPGFTEKYNQVCCNCKLEIGVIYADCMGSHFLAINAEQLTVTPKW